MHPTILAQVDHINFDIEAHHLRDAVLALAVERGARIEIVAAALADVIGIAAAKLDQAGDLHTLQERLHSFCARVEETYQRVRQSSKAG
jgi:hypothetical protein